MPAPFEPDRDHDLDNPVDSGPVPANGSGAGKAVADAYERLRDLAGGMLRGQGAGHTLQPTAVVHEVYLRLAQERDAPERDREHLLALAARAMRQVLIDHARARGATKRGGDWQRVDLTLDSVSGGGSSEVSLVDLNDALGRLEALSERQARVVELRCFGGLSVPEVARVLGASPRTVDNDWRIARAWLRAELAPADGERP